MVFTESFREAMKSAPPDCGSLPGLFLPGPPRRILLMPGCDGRPAIAGGPLCRDFWQVRLRCVRPFPRSCLAHPRLSDEFTGVRRVLFVCIAGSYLFTAVFFLGRSSTHSRPSFLGSSVLFLLTVVVCTACFLLHGLQALPFSGVRLVADPSRDDSASPLVRCFFFFFFFAVWQRLTLESSFFFGSQYRTSFPAPAGADW